MALGRNLWMTCICTSVLLVGTASAQESPSADPSPAAAKSASAEAAESLRAEELDEATTNRVEDSFSDDAFANDEYVDEYDDEGEALVETKAEKTARHKGLEQITVTAEKRSANLQNVPIAISAFSGEELMTRGVEDMNSLSFQVPSFHYGEVLGTARITIRGIAQAAGDPATTFHVDGVYQANGTIANSLTFYDVERVEVLRGPQGTLYGRNSTAGSVNVITRKPVDDYEAFADISYGSYDQIFSRATLNLPIVDGKVAFRGSVFQDRRYGYQENLFPTMRKGQDADDNRDVGFRGALRFTPLEELDITIRGQYLHQGGVGFANKIQGDVPGTFELANVPGIGPININPYSLARPNPSDPRKIYLDTQNEQDATNWSISGEATYDFHAPGVNDMSFNVAFGYYEQERTQTNDVDLTSVPSIYANTDAPVKDWVVDAHFASESEGAFQWLLGGIYLGQNGDVNLDLPTTIYAGTTDPSDPSGLIVTFPNGINAVEGVNQRNHFELSSGAIYGHGSYSFYDDQMTASLGLRWTRDKKRGVQDDTQINLVLNPFLAVCTTPALYRDDEETWNAATGEAKFEYQFKEENMVYTSVARGFKSGTIEQSVSLFADTLLANRQCGPAAVTLYPENADPETVWAFEIGNKNRFLEDRLQANFTGFFYLYNDYQVGQLTNTTTVVENADGAHVGGVEVELTYLPTDELLLTANYGFLYTEFTGYDARLAEDPSVVVDLSGNRLPRAPTHSATFAAQYTQELGRYGSIMPRLQYYVSSDLYYRGANYESDRQEAYGLLDFRMRWQRADDAVYIEGWVDNIMDTDVINTKLISSALLGRPVVTAYDPPRTWGIRAGFTW